MTSKKQLRQAFGKFPGKKERLEEPITAETIRESGVFADESWNRRHPAETPERGVPVANPVMPVTPQPRQSVEFDGGDRMTFVVIAVVLLVLLACLIWAGSNWYILNGG